MKRIQLIHFPVLICLLGLSGGAFAEGDYTFYGAFKVSVDSVDDGKETNLSVSNNSSRLGIKGGKSLQPDMDLVYQLEMEFDTTEQQTFTGRNSFIGVKGGYGNILAGQHDTPLKAVRAHGTDLFGDTIADVRSIIGAVADDAGAKLDIRARNAIMYQSPDSNRTQLFLLYSTDTEPASTVDNNSNNLVSISVTQLQGPLYMGIAYQNQSRSIGEDIDAIRFAASYRFTDYRVGGIFETSDAGSNSSLTRDAYAINGRYNLSPRTWVGVQLAIVDDYDGSTGTGASNISTGISHDLAQTTRVYAVLSYTGNDSNAAFGLSQGGIQDSVTAAAPGENVTGISVGLVHMF